MTTAAGPYKMPPRRWGDEPDEPVELPVIIVSSRDDVPAPRVPAAVALEAAATAHGFTVRQTYALASVPETRYKNGKLRKAAHLLHSVAVRMTRCAREGDTVGTAPGNVHGFAVWHREAHGDEPDDGGWRFAHAWMAGEMHGARSIVERVSS